MTNNAAARRIVFIDPTVPHLQTLLDGIGDAAAVFVLDPNQDGVQQIANILAANDLNDLAAIQIVSHGNDGSVTLGSTVLDSGNVADYADALAQIGEALAPGGDLMLYGCEVADGAAGQEFIDALADLTGANVAASTDSTGAAALGGDWTLEAATGPIETGAPFTAEALDSYSALLVNETFTVTQTTVLKTDNDVGGPDGVIDPGDVVTTTVTINNNSPDANATGVTFTEDLQGMTLVPSSIKVTPIAFDDNGGSLEGNTPITFLESTFLANDVDPDGVPGTLDIVSVSNAVNGTVSIDNVTGQITFTPTTGFEGPASFQYTVRDAQNLDSVTTGTVTLTVTDAVWYVDSAYAGQNGASDGSFLRPHVSLAPLTTGGASDGLDDAGDTIFIYDRGGAGYTGQGIVLEAGQKLLGDGSTLTSVNGNAVGVTANNSDISNNGGLLVTLGTGNTISGLDLGNSSTAISGTISAH